MAATHEAPTTEAEIVARRYFGAIAERDMDAAVACWKPGGREVVRGILDGAAPEAVHEVVGGLMAAVPDLRFEIVSTVTEGDRCAVQWRARGTFAGEPLQGFAATGAQLDLEGCDVLTVEDGRIVRNDAYTDGLTFARQAGVMPPQGSKQETRLQGAANLRTRLAQRVRGDGELEEVADGVWLVRGGFPGRAMNVYLVRDGDGVLCFDGGVRAMAASVASAGARLGGITRVVLGHGHPDHRGIAPALGVPVLCHPLERADAEGDGGVHYFDPAKLPRSARLLMPRMLRGWDGGPVTIDGTVEEGDEVAGFRVIHLPGHAPGMIGLWRESDRLALTSDCFYTLDPLTGRKGPARVPHAAFNHDTEQARASIRKLAAMEPAAAWPGHADPLTGDVRSALETAAATT